MNLLRLIKELVYAANKSCRDKAWLLPLIVFLLVTAAVFLIGSTMGALAPFIYPLF